MTKKIDEIINAFRDGMFDALAYGNRDRGGHAHKHKNIVQHYYNQGYDSGNRMYGDLLEILENNHSTNYEQLAEALVGDDATKRYTIDELLDYTGELKNIEEKYNG